MPDVDQVVEGSCPSSTVFRSVAGVAGVAGSAVARSTLASENIGTTTAPRVSPSVPMPPRLALQLPRLPKLPELQPVLPVFADPGC